MIQFEHVSFGYPEHGGAVEDVSFTLKKGGVTAIIGSNGAGKSTVSRLMRGLLKPVSGRVLLDGQDIAGMKISTLAARIGFLFQNPDRQICRNTIEEELRFTLRLTVPDPQRREACLKETLDALQLDPQDDPMLLSRGEKQRVALATAMVHQPELLILDEPTTGLDYRECTRIMEYIETFHRKGATVVIVCHDMEVVLDYTDEVIVMSGGHLIRKGETAEIFRDAETLRAASLLPPQMIDLAGRLGGEYSGIARVEEMRDAIVRSRKAVRA